MVQFFPAPAEPNVCSNGRIKHSAAPAGQHVVELHAKYSRTNYEHSAPLEPERVVRIVYKHSAPLEPERVVRIVYKHSAPLEPERVARIVYKHSAPLEPERVGRISTNIPLRRSSRTVFLQTLARTSGLG